MGEMSEPNDTGSERTSHLPDVLVIERALPASYMRENGEGQFSRRHQGPIDDVLSCFDRLLRTERELCQINKMSQLCSTETNEEQHGMECVLEYVSHHVLSRMLNRNISTGSVSKQFMNQAGEH